MSGFELYAPREARHRRTWSVVVPVLVIVFSIIASMLVMIPYFIDVFHIMAANPKATPPKPVINDFIMFAPTGIGIVLTCAWVMLFERRPLSAMGFNAKGLTRFVRGYLVGCAFLLTVIGLIWLSGGYVVESAGVWKAPTLTAFLPILIYAALFIMQGSSEEVMMRGWFMGILASRHGLVLAVIINAVIFGAMHLGNLEPSPAMFAGCANVVLFGVFISLYACRERSIWGVCGWHAAWNWLLGLGFGIEVSGIKLKADALVIDLMDKPGTPWWISGGVWGAEASVITTAVLVIGISVLIWKGALKPGDSYPAPLASQP